MKDKKEYQSFIISAKPGTTITTDKPIQLYHTGQENPTYSRKWLFLGSLNWIDLENKKEVNQNGTKKSN